MRNREGYATVECDILRFNFDKEQVEPRKDKIVAEEYLELYLNKQPYAEFSFTPSETRELVIGHLLSEGLIDNLKDILNLEVSGKTAHAFLSKKSESRLPGESRFMISACGGASAKIGPRLLKKIMKMKHSRIQFEPKVIAEAVRLLNSLSVTFKATGGTHASVIIDADGNIRAFAEDIGRHNAIDKSVGKAVLKGTELNKVLLASTGRLSSEMVAKACILEIPIVVSISAPTSMGVKIAESSNITLIGFARGKRFNIYTCSERIKLKSSDRITPDTSSPS